MLFDTRELGEKMLFCLDRKWCNGALQAPREDTGTKELERRASLSYFNSTISNHQVTYVIYSNGIIKHNKKI
jgi:hypothetical protein